MGKKIPSLYPMGFSLNLMSFITVPPTNKYTTFHTNRPYYCTVNHQIYDISHKLPILLHRRPPGIRYFTQTAHTTLPPPTRYTIRTNCPYYFATNHQVYDISHKLPMLPHRNPPGVRYFTQTKNSPYFNSAIFGLLRQGELVSSYYSYIDTTGFVCSRLRPTEKIAIGMPVSSDIRFK